MALNDVDMAPNHITSIEGLKELVKKWRIHQRLSSLYVPSPLDMFTRDYLSDRFRDAFVAYAGSGAFRANRRLLTDFVSCAALVEFTSQFDTDGRTLRRGQDRAPIVWQTTPKKDLNQVRHQPPSVYLSLLGISRNDVTKIAIDASVRNVSEKSGICHSLCLPIVNREGKIQQFTPYVKPQDLSEDIGPPPARRARRVDTNKHKKLCVCLNKEELQSEMFSRMGHVQVPISNVGLLKTGNRLGNMFNESEIIFDVQLWLKDFNPEIPIHFTVASNRFIVSPGRNSDKDPERFMCMGWNILHGCIAGNGQFQGAERMKALDLRLQWHIVREFLRNYLKMRNPAIRSLDEREIRLLQTKLFLSDAMQHREAIAALFDTARYDERNLNYGYSEEMPILDSDTMQMRKEKTKENRRRIEKNRRQFRTRLHNTAVRDDYEVSFARMMQHCPGLLDRSTDKHSSIAVYLENVLQLLECNTHQLETNLTKKLKADNNIGHMLYLFRERYITLTDTLVSYRVFRALGKQRLGPAVENPKRPLQLRIHEDEGHTLIIQYAHPERPHEERPQCVPLPLCAIADAKKKGGLNWNIKYGHSRHYNAIVQLKGADFGTPSIESCSPTMPVLEEPIGSMETVPCPAFYDNPGLDTTSTAPSDPPDPSEYPQFPIIGDLASSDPYGYLYAQHPIGDMQPSSSSFLQPIPSYSEFNPPLPSYQHFDLSTNSSGGGDDNDESSLSSISMMPSTGRRPTIDYCEDYRVILVPISKLFGRRKTTAPYILHHQIDPITGNLLSRQELYPITRNPDLDGFSEINYTLASLSLGSKSLVEAP